MSYSDQTRYEQLLGRVVPIPRQAQALESAPLKLTRTTVFTLSAPEAEYGPVMTAGQRIRALLESKCGEDCLRGGDGAVSVTLALEEPPFEAACADQGYRLTITEKAITITGFGPAGLLYGVITLEQLNLWDIRGCEIPAMEILDWPDSHYRGMKQECRWGSDMMERDEWMEYLEDLVSKKLNAVGLAMYGCWGVQYDGRVSEYIYLPVKGHPELQTPKLVKYWSVEQNRWVTCEKLPPIFRDNLMEDIFRKARDLGIQIAPGWNSYGHNTLLPAKIPDVSSKDENGEPSLVGFCTSNPATYELLFSIYDQIIDDYMIPYGMDTFNLMLDEVHAGIGKNAEDIFKNRDPWCSCPQCKALGRGKGDTFIDHVVKLVGHIHGRGIKNVVVACDMLDPKRNRGMGEENLPQRLRSALQAKGLEDALMLGWWSYHDIPEKCSIKSLYPELGLRGYVAPWNGYHLWSVALNPLENIRMAAEVNKRDGGEGMFAYALWDRAADRAHDAIADYTWNFDASGATTEVTRRYALRRFGPRAHEAFRAFRFMDWCTEERFCTKWSFPDAERISNWDLLSYRLVPYNMAYPKLGKPYPRAFLDEALEFILTMRYDMERTLYSISAMAKEAKEIFLELAEDYRCDHSIAMRQAYECENYQVLVEDWLAILEMYDLTQSGDQKAIAPIARSREAARLALIARGERNKERCVAESMALRQHCIFMQIFADIADYIESTDQPKLDLLNVHEVLSETSLWLR